MLWSVLVALAQLAVLAVLPVLGFGARSLVLSRFRRIRYEAVPMVAVPAWIFGGLFGLALVLGRAWPEDWFTLAGLFGPDSAWALSFRELLTQRLNPFAYLPSRPPLDLRLYGTDLPSTTLTIAAAGFAASLAAVPFKWRPAQVPAAAFCHVATAAFAAGLAVYALGAAAWLLYSMNFWVVLAAFFILRYYKRMG